MPRKRQSKRSGSAEPANTDMRPSTETCPSIMPARLTAEQTALYDQHVRLDVKLKRARKLARKVKRLRKQLQAAFGPAYLAFTIDGRLIQRRHNARQLEPLPAKTIEWEDFAEIPVWDA